MSWTSSIISTSINVFLIIVGIFGNFFILTMIVKKKKTNDLTNYFIFNLSLADLAISVIVIPLTIAFNNQTWIPAKWDCFFVMPILEHFAVVCVLTHTAISIVRYMVVSQRKIVQIIQLKHIVFFILLIWLTSFVVLSATMMGGLGQFIITYTNTSNKLKSSRCVIDFNNPSRKMIYTVMIFSLTYVLPMVCTGFSHYQIYKVVSKNAKFIRGHVTKDLLISRKRISRRLNRILLIMYIFFGISTLPIQALYFFAGIMNISENIFNNIWEVSFPLFYLQVVTNPLVLLYMRIEYRKELYEISLCFSNFFNLKSKITTDVKINKKTIYTKTQQFKAISSNKILFNFRKSKKRVQMRSLYSNKKKELTFNFVKIEKSSNTENEALFHFSYDSIKETFL
ncbi:galanin receptor type 1 [Hydra vulgaris]|uniref:Galanin receptor type 1 n=1 Tax=Hydra vulgaris TaxID=6087 RepID=A0ABM4CBP8_HYDVU